MSRQNLLVAGVAATLAVFHGPSAHAQQTAADNASQAEPAGDTGLAEIIVTAQRRSESLARTPVAVSALSGDDLQKQAIGSESDLQSAVPGLTVKAGQSNNQLNYSLRGQTVDSFTSSRPSVLPYFNEVQIGGSGSSAFYDLQSVQVLKGPQGTLFGRNSTGGAVLFTTSKPTNELGGYASIRGGNYGDFLAEGALNTPIIDDKLLLRVAGLIQRRDGFQYNLYDGSRPGDVKREGVRVSLTFKPVEGIKNDLVIDYAHSLGSNTSSVVYNVSPLNAPVAPFVPNNVLYTPALDQAFGGAFGPGAWNAYLAAHPKADPAGIIAFGATQAARGPFTINVDAPNFHRANNMTISNVSTFDVGTDTQIKNVFGFGHYNVVDASEFDGTPFSADSNGNIGRGGTLRQISEEVQLVGKALDKNLSYVTGLYFSDEKDHTLSLSQILDLAPFIPVTNQINDGDRTNKTYAAYAQGTYDLSTMTGVQGLGVTVGGRYSSEKVTFTHLADDVYIASPVPPGATYVNPLSDTFKKFSWQLGVQEQLNSNVLLYAVTRRSFRSGGFNFFAPPLAGFGNDGGSEYKPESATDIEIGVKFQGDLADMPVRLNLAAYELKIDDIQRANYVQIFGSLAGITVNVPRSKVTGLELDGVIKPVNWLSLGGSLNSTNARFTSNLVSVLGNPAVAFGPYPDTPKTSGTLFADASIPLNAELNLNLRADVYGQSENYFSSTANTLNPGTRIPGYGVANFRIGVGQNDKGWSVAANIKNAFNRVYYVGGVGFASLFALNTVIPGDPRTYTVEARYKF